MTIKTYNFSFVPAFHRKRSLLKFLALLLLVSFVFFLNCVHNRLEEMRTTRENLVPPRGSPQVIGVTNLISDNAIGIYKRLLQGSSIPSKDVEIGCRIPKLDPFDPSIIDLVSKIPEPLNCHLNNKYPLLFNSSVDPYPHLLPVRPLQEMTSLGVRSCSYQKIVRKEWDDKTFDKEDEEFRINLNRPTEIPCGHDAIVIYCDMKGGGDHAVERKIIDVHAFVHYENINLKDNNKKENKNKLNVIVLGLDTMSRMSFIRTMPRSYAYLMKKLGAIEMTAYQKIGGNTFPNIAPLLTNLPTIDEVKLECEMYKRFDDCPFIWSHYAEAGYATMYTEDVDKIALFYSERDGFLNGPPTHYYPRPYTVAASDLIGHKAERWTKSKACFGPRPAFQVMLEYMQKISYVMTAGSKPYFQFGWSVSSTHYNEHGGRLLDKFFREGLQWWSDGGYLNNTILILLSDHGLRFNKINAHYQGQLEDRLPFMYFVLPPWFRDRYPKHYKNLISNRNRLVTVLDLHQTLLDIVNLDAIKDRSRPQWVSSVDDPLWSPKQLFKGISLFLPIPPKRNCQMAGVADVYCVCNKEMRPLSGQDDDVRMAARYAVHFLNRKLLALKHCATINLVRILQASQVSFGGKMHWKAMQISFETEPGKATYETFIFYDGWARWSVSGQIARTNPYGNQSYCVEEKWAKYYCFCMEEALETKTLEFIPAFIFTDSGGNRFDGNSIHNV